MGLSSTEVSHPYVTSRYWEEEGKRKLPEKVFIALKYEVSISYVTVVFFSLDLERKEISGLGT